MMGDALELKVFQAGINFLAKSTNQRQADPVPFMVQIGKDRMVSLISGDRESVYVWRTGHRMGERGLKEGISSKALVQAAKSLKGKDLQIGWGYTDSSLVITTSKGGTVTLPFVEVPELKSPRMGEEVQVVELPEGRLQQLANGFTAAGDGPLTCHVQFLEGEVRASEDHMVFQAPVGYVGPPCTVATPFWNALCAPDSNAVLSFFESGLRVRVGEFEGFTGFVEARKMIPDFKNKVFQHKPDIYVVVNKRLLSSSIKIVANKDQQVRISRSSSGEFALSGIQTKQHTTIDAKGKGWGPITLAADYLQDILGAIDSKDVILAWRTDMLSPIGIKGTARQGDVFLLAPVEVI